MALSNPIIKKITEAEPGTYIIFFSYECPYSDDALKSLRKSGNPYKGYVIEEINGDMERLLKVLNKYAELIDFNPRHTTKPIIFLNGKFLGGYKELFEHFKQMEKKK